MSRTRLTFEPAPHPLLSDFLPEVRPTPTPCGSFLYRREDVTQRKDVETDDSDKYEEQHYRHRIPLPRSSPNVITNATSAGKDLRSTPQLVGRSSSVYRNMLARPPRGRNPVPVHRGDGWERERRSRTPGCVYMYIAYRSRRQVRMVSEHPRRSGFGRLRGYRGYLGCHRPREIPGPWFRGFYRGNISGSG